MKRKNDKNPQNTRLEGVQRKLRLISTLVLLACLFGVVAVPASEAGLSEWTTNGPYGDSISAIAVDPTNPQVIYAGILTSTSTGGPGGVYKSTDGAATWTGPSAGMGNSIVWSLAVDPANPQILYAGTASGVYKSTDGAASWEAIHEGMGVRQVSALVVDPANPQILYAGVSMFGGSTSPCMYKSTDGGMNWSTSNEGMGNLKVSALVLDPQNPQTLYAGIPGGGVYKSTNGAGTWSDASQGLASDNVSTLAVDPLNPQIIYAGTSLNGVYKSIDGAVNWTVASQGMGNNVTALALDPINPNILYAGTPFNGVYKSSDGAVNWTAVNVGQIPDYDSINALAVDPQNPQNIYAATSFVGIYKSSNGAANWDVASEGMENLPAYALVVDPQNSQILYAGTLLGVYKSTDGAASWSAAREGLSHPNIQSLAVDPQNTQILYAGSNLDGVFKSTDGATTWSAANTGISGNISDLVVDPENPQILYAVRQGGFGDMLYKSTDGATSWFDPITGTSPVHFNSLTMDQQNTETLYMGGGGSGSSHVMGVLKSTDSAATWSAANVGMNNFSVTALAMDPLDPQILYAGGGAIDGMYKSTDGAASWNTANEGLNILYVQALAVSPHNPQNLYAGGPAFLGQPVYKSTNGGTTWEAAGQGIEGSDVNALAVDPETPQTVYAATMTGVFVRSAWEASNNAPVIVLNPEEIIVNEGSSLENCSGYFTDPGSATWSAMVDFGDGTGWQSLPLQGGGFNLEHNYSENGVYTVTVNVIDEGGEVGAGLLEVTVLNVTPNVSEIAMVEEPVAVGADVMAEADFSDPGLLDTFTALWDWGDGDSGVGIVSASMGVGTVTGSHAYVTSGIYSVTLEVTDDDGGVGTILRNFIVIYDPTSGFVTGGGWIKSPVGAYAADPNLTGKANFGFVSRYKKGASSPTGRSEFQFHAADFNFHSDSYKWLVISGAAARYKGVGTIKGMDGTYKFLLTSIDADKNKNDAFDIDRFRIKVWSEDTLGVETVAYDNGLGAADDDDAAAQEIAGGSVVVHK